MKTANHYKKEELLCPHTVKRDGEDAWRYLQPIVIDFLDWVREELDRPVYVNNYLWGGDKSQRGHRCNLCPLVKNSTLKNVLYVTAHMTGLGVDFNVKGMTSDEVREWLDKNIYRFFDKFPQYIRKCRIESAAYAPTWCHIDFYLHDNPGIIRYISPIKQV